FFFSSRRRHTRFSRDWSSDVCSSDLDNFDFSQNSASLPLTIYSWTKASPPLFGNDGRPDETLDYRHQGDLMWHSSFTEQYYRIYGNTGNSYTNSRDRKSTRLNSSHVKISYAVFCLKK